jgi:hypothetical protein
VIYNKGRTKGERAQGKFHTAMGVSGIVISALPYSFQPKGKKEVLIYKMILECGENGKRETIMTSTLPK